VLVSGMGYLSEPKMPDIPGLENFEGEVFHTARWNHDVDLGGKRHGDGERLFSQLKVLAYRPAEWPWRFEPMGDRRLVDRLPGRGETGAVQGMGRNVARHLIGSSPKCE
jgi:hypothetical protein